MSTVSLGESDSFCQDPDTASRARPKKPESKLQVRTCLPRSLYQASLAMQIHCLKYLGHLNTYLDDLDNEFQLC